MRSSLLALHMAYGRVVGWFATIAGVILFLLMWLVCINALSRWALNVPVPGSLEITEALMPMVILLPMAFTQFRGGHIRVELLTNRLSLANRRLLRIVILFLTAGLLVWIAVATYEFAFRSYRIGETTWGAVRIPLWITKASISVGSGLLAFQYLLDALRMIIAPDLDVEEADDAQGGEF